MKQVKLDKLEPLTFNDFFDQWVDSYDELLLEIDSFGPVKPVKGLRIGRFWGRMA